MGSTQVQFGVPARTSVKAIVGACGQLPGPLAIQVEAHTNARRKLRWFTLFGDENRDPDATMRKLLAKLPVITVAIHYSTAEFSSYWTVEKSKRIELTFEAVDDRDALAKQFSKPDADAFLRAPSDYADKARGWKAFGRVRGPLREDAKLDKATRIDGWAVAWEALADWRPSTPERRGARAVITHRALANGEVWETDALIKWQHADDRGLVGTCWTEKRVTEIWTAGPKRDAAIRRHAVDGWCDCLADEDHVYGIAGGALSRVARDGSSTVEKLAEASWLSSVCGFAQDGAALYVTAAGALFRIAKQGGEPQRVATIAGETTWRLAVSDREIAFDDWNDDLERVGLAAIGKQGGPVRVLSASLQPEHVTASGSSIAWAHRNIVHVDDGKQQREMSVDNVVVGLKASRDAIYVLEATGRGRNLYRIPNDGKAHTLLGSVATDLADDAAPNGRLQAKALLAVERDHVLWQTDVGSLSRAPILATGG